MVRSCTAACLREVGLRDGGRQSLLVFFRLFLRRGPVLKLGEKRNQLAVSFVQPDNFGQPACGVQCTEGIGVVEALIVGPAVPCLAQLGGVAACVMREVEGVAK
jgi:hypothetical protein